MWVSPDADLPRPANHHMGELESEISSSTWALGYGSFGQPLDGNLIRDSKPKKHPVKLHPNSSLMETVKATQFAMICYTAKDDWHPTHYCLLLVPNQSLGMVVSELPSGDGTLPGSFCDWDPSPLTPHSLREQTLLPTVPLHWLDHS